MPEPIRIELAPSRHVTALAYGATAPRAGITLILAPGAGAGQKSSFMVRFAAAIAARGVDTVTFDFPYREEGRRIPDNNATLEACWRAVIALVRRRLAPAQTIAIGGKSMGGRIASQVAASGGAGAIAGLVLLGYPLHPPGKPQQLRTAHFPSLRVPSLFIQGARDAFGTPEELIAALAAAGVPATLFPIAGADHSFKVAKRAGGSDVVESAIQDKIATWLSEYATG
ncbi:MAG TPA: alpha/beta fold hydrolase [Stellaceae bacterium]|nr:alpha/beta fold hydrolase [Stellaceae bacterium]